MAQRKGRTNAGPEHRRIEEPIEERSPNNQTTGGWDPEDYPGSGPLPVGQATVHPTRDSSSSIPAGVTVDQSAPSNPGDVPGTAPDHSGADPEAIGDTAKPDEALKKAS
jgi:hypothetical protein